MPSAFLGEKKHLVLQVLVSWEQGFHLDSEYCLAVAALNSRSQAKPWWRPKAQAQ
jgi:hypothetical protein